MSTVDPGIGESVSKAAEDLEPDHNHKDTLQEDDDEDYMQPNTWWFASTLCPLLGATFGPVANGFSICALVYPWRSYIPDGKAAADGQKMTDPQWLLAVNAVSLVFALAGNLTLLLNMARRVKFSIAQPITIVGYIVAGILLIADTAALSSGTNYYITDPKAIPPANHALSSAYYYAIIAAAIYMILGLLSCLTVYGAIAGRYEKEFNLGPAQRTLMLQTMSFITYELLGALVFSKIENWKYLDAVYWSQVTLLTIGLGDYSPQTNVGRGLLFPFALGGILMVGLVVGSIRSLVLERGQEKMAARITEKRRESAVNNVDERKQTIRISWFAQADFSTDPSLTPAQRREEEFRIMRKVQKASERERRYFALCMSLSFALLLWFVGAVIFMLCEKAQGWTYFESLYFSFTSLLTIGYGDPSPASNSGKTFFVMWSLLAVPSLTILISNMGDTIVKWFTDATEWVAKLTVLPDEGGFRNSIRNVIRQIAEAGRQSKFTPPGVLGVARKDDAKLDGWKHYEQVMVRLATRLEKHVEDDELEEALMADSQGQDLERDIHFYHYVLSRELREVQKHVQDSPPKQYSWGEWEYYLRLMGNGNDDPEDFPDQAIPNILVPNAMRVSNNTAEQPKGQCDASKVSDEHESSVSGALVPKAPPVTGTSSDSEGTLADTDGTVDRTTERKEKLTWTTQPEHSHVKKLRIRRKQASDTDALRDWSWLSDQSPLMSMKTESEWIMERLSAALVRELNRQKKGYKRQPPVSMGHIIRAKRLNERASQEHQAGEHRLEQQDRSEAVDEQEMYASGEK